MIDRCTAEGAFGVVAVTLATGEKHCIVYSTNMPASKSIISAFALSPDEKTIAFLAPSPVTFSEVFTVPITGGTPRQITREGPIGGCSKDTDVGCTGLAWAPDGRSILFGRNLDEQGSLWAVAVNGGHIYRETNYPAVGSFSKDGRRLVFSAISASTPQAIWRADLSTPEGRVLENRPIVRTLLDEADAQPSPDNSQIAWMSIRTGTTEIWTSSATGENPFQVTHMKAYTGTPRWSPDGKTIAFDSVTPQIKAGPQIHLIDADGRNLRKITKGEFDGVVPSWSSDGKSIYFASNRSGIWQVWKHSLESGSEAQVTKHGGFNAFESPDGRTVYFSRYEQAGIWSVPQGGGAETLVVADKPQAGYWGYWAITRSGLYFLNVSSNPGYRIEFYDFGSHRTTPVLTLAAIPPALQPSLSATLDGRSIFYTQEHFESVLKLAKLSPKP
jgi:Tol biopolymer transport system component